MGPFHSLFYILLGIVAWTLPWVAFHGLLARMRPGSYSPEGTPTDPVALGASLAVALVLSVLAGFLTARLAHRRPMTHVFALGLVQLSLAASVQLQHGSSMPVYYHVAFLGLILPGHLIGGRLGASSRNAAPTTRHDALD